MSNENDNARIEKLESRIQDLVKVQRQMADMFPMLQAANIELARLAVVQRNDTTLMARIVAACVVFSDAELKTAFTDLVARMESCSEQVEALVSKMKK